MIRQARFTAFTFNRLYLYLHSIIAFVFLFILYGCPAPRYRYRIVSEDISLAQTTQLKSRLIKVEANAFYSYAYYHTLGSGVNSIFELNLKNHSNDTLRIAHDDIKIQSKRYNYRLLDIYSKPKTGLFSSSPGETYNSQNPTIEISPKKSESLNIIAWRSAASPDSSMSYSVHPFSDERITLIIDKILLKDKNLGRYEVTFKPD